MANALSGRLAVAVCLVAARCADGNSAVFVGLGPSLNATASAVLIAGVVAEGIISWATVVGAGFSMVELAAHHMVGVVQFAVVVVMDVLGPVLADA